MTPRPPSSSAEDVARLKALEKKNARLKRLLAEKELDNDMLREVARGNF
jgi:putative transposase